MKESQGWDKDAICTIATQVATLDFVIPDSEDIAPEALAKLRMDLAMTAQRMLLIFSSVILAPDHIVLFDRVLKTCAEMIKDELKKGDE